MCPAPPHHSKAPAVPIADGDHLIHIESDDASIDSEGHAVVNGRVIVRQDARTVAADSMTYDRDTGKLTVTGKVDFEDPKLRIKSESGDYDALAGADFDKANFQILERNGRGFAQKMSATPDGKISLDQVRYTTCPVGNEDWMLQASSINMDTTTEEGVGRGVVMRFKDVPIFYTPYISFPLGDERKSGLLFPSFGHSGTNGYQIDIPYYFNLAPNYDLTLTPSYLSARGVQLSEQFRYLTESSHGVIDGSFLPNDTQEHGNRTYFHFNDVTNLAEGLRFDTDVASVSDVDYFSDFSVGSEQTSVTFLERRAEVLYYDDDWRIRGELQNFQTIDSLLSDLDRPYSSVPRIEAEGLWPIKNSNLEFALNSEFVNFMHKDIDDVLYFNPNTNATVAPVFPTGVRVDVSPEVRWSTREAGYFFEPAVGYHFTQYDLENAGPGLPSTPTRTLPYARLDTGLVFEREAGSQGQRTQTLEPRLVYSYVPYRNQRELPIFDTAVPDLNLTELFRTNRFVGDDRISDANQLAAGLTTRLFDSASGTQYLSATIGQIRYLSIPRVTIPEDPLLTNYYLNDCGTNVAATGRVMALPNPFATADLFLPRVRAQTLTPPAPGQPCVNAATGQLETVQPGQISEQYPASDIVTEVALTAYKNLSVNVNYQWNPYTSHTDKEEVGVQYHPDNSKVVNLEYRFQTGILKQWDGSFVWPIAGHWNTVGRWVYSLRQNYDNVPQAAQTLEQVAGIEYKSCCYRIQIVQRRYLTSHTVNGALDTSFALQLELTGLSSVGKPADSFLQKEIRGYPIRDPSTSDVP
jgi:LPS-assembly protein